MDVVLKTEIPELKLIGRGKVRDIYDLGNYLLIVTTDRISAFDVILPNGIPYKGYVLTQLSKFWFEKTSHIVKNHLITTDIEEMPEICKKYRNILEGRSMLVEKAKPYPVECVVRGYITGSGWKDYQKTGEVCGIKLPKNLKESQKLEPPLFTPATKAEIGEHDENISFEQMVLMVGQKTAEKLRDYAIKIYTYCAKIAEEKGIIIADTKMEFGNKDGEIILIDELLTPDSSRFWFKEKYKVGEPQESMDKQFVRNYLETLDWDKKAPGPELPKEIIEQTSKRYLEIMEILTK
ncbi:phosphoribosylaminoimidazole-succinocarboxamide synthase [Deferribacter desulfuricans SSM1]|uniref:Phosphoribosylaminoimidazole-succinocarboxamide synthase n=1 Tax=Deferribacter desulfuricans (strain DSM 14783 / JCM 11476 / NBRC 101012 / SSM1) TaxID=639282 RepID=D3P9C5_DEFDS|nr:phosphoribosylaminoimidazolesuccinocarboxamide synthase [Deferribacter desulfuricans]BAI81315.1 phosphoribosylaminoimidazole-succinocarboxamide synthase [Deferribacter desulfuricans SSM1]